MKIFICGLPKSGRTTVAKSLSDNTDLRYIDASSWIRNEFREPDEKEHPHQYEDEFQAFLTKSMLEDTGLVSDYVEKYLRFTNDKDIIVIDGIASPKDFAALFDYGKDIIVFLNRIDNEHEMRDHENIGVSVMRDYCFWMSSAGLLSKEKWFEYNFRIPGEESDFVKNLGSKNSVFIVKSINKVISHLKEKLRGHGYELPQ